MKGYPPEARKVPGACHSNILWVSSPFHNPQQEMSATFLQAMHVWKPEALTFKCKEAMPPHHGDFTGGGAHSALPCSPLPFQNFNCFLPQFS